MELFLKNSVNCPWVFMEEECVTEVASKKKKKTRESVIKILENGHVATFFI